MSEITTCTQPELALQLSAVQGLESLQFSPGPGWQRPAWHVSPTVHMLESLHVVPFGACGLEQAPVCVSHVPATWH
jgi:hypothetical protein